MFAARHKKFSPAGAREIYSLINLSVQMTPIVPLIEAGKNPGVRPSETEV
jgi:hypothetical protein